MADVTYGNVNNDHICAWLVHCPGNLQEASPDRTFGLQVLSTALVKAERENATVYLQRVPNFADLPPIQPYILVKSLPLADVDASQESLFHSVIPDSR